MHSAWYGAWHIAGFGVVTESIVVVLLLAGEPAQGMVMMIVTT